MSVYITQLLCPRSHCILALAWEDDQRSIAESEKDVRERFDSMVATGALIAECGICKSTELVCETRRTRFQTLDDAAPTLAALQAANMLTADLLRWEDS